jgi:HSP20 family molecular chaperone IbpA
VSLEAVISKSGRLAGTRGRVARVERYSREIRLPVRVDPSKASARYRNGMLAIRLPIVRSGRTIKIAD